MYRIEVKPLVKLLNLLEGTKEGVALVADESRRRRLVHLAVVDVHDVLHVADELFLRLHQLLHHRPVSFIKQFQLKLSK